MSINLYVYEYKYAIIIQMDERVDVLGNKHLFKFSESDSEMKLELQSDFTNVYPINSAWEIQLTRAPVQKTD